MNHDTISHILSFVDAAYAYIAPVSRTWRRAYATCHGADDTRTAVRQAVASESTVRGILLRLRVDESLNNAAFFHASKGGSSLRVLDLLLDNKRPRALFACAHGAVAGEQVQSLAWTVANRFPLDRFVCLAAASAGNLDMFVLAVTSGCPWDQDLCRKASAQNAVGRFLANLK